MIVEKIRQSGNCECCSDRQNSRRVTMDVALGIIVDQILPICEIETILLHTAKGRVLAKDIFARSNSPPFDNSAVDGYALHSGALQGNGPWNLRVIERVAAGQTSNLKLNGLFASQIFTGAAVPLGANAIIMQEDVLRSGSSIILDHVPRASAHIRFAGEDMAMGDKLLTRGTVVSSAGIAACAAAGFEKVDVVRKIRAALVVSGNEMQTAGSTLLPGCIWDVNTPMLTGLLAQPLIDLIQVVHISDQQQATETRLSELSGEADLIVTSGGLSSGDEDHLRPAIYKLGGKIDFSGVAIKPGKPVSFGRLNRSFWLGLPGNPLAAFTTWQIFGEAVLRGLTKQDVQKSLRRNVLLSKSIHKKVDRCELRLARIEGCAANGQEIVKFEEATHSGRVAFLPITDGLIFLPKDVVFLPQGAMVEFLPFC